MLNNHTFEIDCGAINNIGDYVFKSLKMMAKMAIQMDINGPANPLHNEEYFFNGLPRDVKDRKHWHGGFAQ